MATKTTNNSAAQEAAKKAVAAANAKKSAGTTKASGEKKKVEHTYTQVSQQSGGKEDLLEITKGNALPYRIGAIVCWVIAIVFEVLAILFFVHKLEPAFTAETTGWYIAWIGALVLDLVFLIIGSQLWKKGNHLDPAPKKNKVRFWLQNNMGMIVAAIAFIPFVIIALTDKNADKQSKTVAAIVAAVALGVGLLTGHDWNPVSQEEVLEAAGLDTTVYWTAGGSVYHAYDDCSHLNNTAELLTGTPAAAIEAGKTRLCKTCEARALKEEGVEEALKDAANDSNADDGTAAGN